MTSEQNYECIKCGSIMTHTRAVPDVPELVRYNLYTHKPMEQSETGLYVLHSQAAAIIAAKDVEIQELKEKLGVVSAERHADAEYIGHLEAKLTTANALLTCMRGAEVERHTIGDGHSPVDQYHYDLNNIKDQLQESIKELAQIKAQEPVAWLCEYLEGDAPKSITTFALSAMIKLKNEGCEIVPLYTAPIDQTAEIERYREKYREAVRNAFKDSNAALSGEEPS